MPWYGNIVSIPSGFSYCDGTNGTPDLRGRTLVGTGSFVDIYGSLTYNIGTYGGERMHQLTTDEMPSHGGHYRGFLNGTGQAEQGGGSQNAFIDKVYGGNQPHNLMQPYMAVHYIMKL